MVGSGLALRPDATPSSVAPSHLGELSVFSRAKAPALTRLGLDRWKLPGVESNPLPSKSGSKRWLLPKEEIGEQLGARHGPIAPQRQTSHSLRCRQPERRLPVPETRMRKLKIIEHISLDGVIQVTGEGCDFPYGDWTAPYRTPAGRDAIMAAHGERFDLLLGRRTYDLWSGFWPQAPSSPIADRLNAATKYVATRRPESLDWGRSRALDRTSSRPFAASRRWTARTSSSRAVPR